MGRFAALVASVVIFATAGKLVDANGGFLRYPSNRFFMGVILTAWLGVALFLRWRHSRKISGQADLEARTVPQQLAAGVRKSCDDAEALGRAALAERWLMLLAVLALAVDPAQVQVDHIPGRSAPAAA
jgi:hypothetical protein